MPRPGPLALLVTVQLMVILDSTVVNVAIPPIQADFGISPGEVSWVLNAYALTFGGLLLGAGRAGDLLGRRRMLVWGVALFTLASALGGSAQTSGELIAARAVQGIGAAAAAPAVLAIITATYAEGTARNRALGIFSAASASGASVGLLLGGVLTGAVSWRWVMWINVPVGLAVLAFAPRVLVETARRTVPLDLVAAAWATLGSASVVYGFVRASESSWGAPLTIASFAVGAVVLAAFVVRMARVPDPLLPLGLILDPARGPAFLAMALVPAAMLGQFFLMTQFLQEVLGYSAIKTGLAFLPLTVAIFVISQIIPRALPRIGMARPMLAGMTLLVIGLLWLSRIGPDSTYAASVLGPMLVFGVGAGLLFMPLSATILSGVAPQFAGAASGVLQTAQQLGSALGVAVLVSVLGAARPDGSTTGGLAAGIGHALLAAAGLGVLAFAALVVVVLPRAASPVPDGEPA